MVGTRAGSCQKAEPTSGWPLTAMGLLLESLDAMGKIVRWRFVIVLLSGLAIFAPVASGELASPEKNSLPPDKLAHYCDTFDSFREDLWEKAGHVFSKEQLRNYKQTRIDVKDGKLVMETETGCFSKGGLISKYALRGDFDIQLNCETTFKKDMEGMDHVLIFSLLEGAKDTQSASSAGIQVMKREKWHTPRVTGYVKKGEYHAATKEDVSLVFVGKLRIERKGDMLHTMYKVEGKDHWNRFGKVPFTANDVYVMVSLQNFVARRTSIDASKSIKAAFDSFQIHSAQGIVESEI
jgi:hypothetical protein